MHVVQPERLLILPISPLAAQLPPALPEVRMHIHANRMNLNAVNPYSAAAEKAAATQRAADVRKKLVKSAIDIEGAANPDEAFMLGRWKNSRQGQPQDDVEYHATTAGKDSDFG